MLQWIELLTKQFNSCPAACEVCLHAYCIFGSLKLEHLNYHLYSFYLFSLCEVCIILDPNELEIYFSRVFEIHVHAHFTYHGYWL